jgi:hypothetical protein
MAKGSKGSNETLPLLYSGEEMVHGEDTSLEVFPGEKVVVNTIQPLRWDDAMNSHQEKMVSRTYKVGDTAIYDGYILSYTGTIVSITAKRIGIVDCGRKYLLTPRKFAFWNERSLEYAIKNNREWMD